MTSVKVRIAVAFDSVKACPKCGSSDIHRKYEPNAHHYDCMMDVSHPKCCTAEHHERYCRGCGYKFAELPIPEPVEVAGSVEE